MSALHHGSAAVVGLQHGDHGRKLLVSHARARVARVVQCVGQQRLRDFVATDAQGAPLVVGAIAQEAAMDSATGQLRVGPVRFVRSRGA